MPNKHAPRAQLFQPFDSLKGLHDMLRQQEEIKVNRRILSEDDLEELNRKIHEIQKGDIIRVIYYNGQDYIQKEGKISKINLDMHLLQVVQTKIPLSRIVDIELIES